MNDPSAVTAGETHAAEEVSVVVVDDHQLFRSGLREVLDEEGVSVVGEAASGEEALRLVSRIDPDVVLMDVNMPGESGVEVTRRLVQHVPDARVLMLTVSARDEDVREAIAAGACGYLVKDASIPELVAGVRAAAGGQSSISPAVATALVDSIREEQRTRQTSDERVQAPLTVREIEVLRLVADGKDNGEIARELTISPETVKNHISNILEKLGVENRIQAAVHAVRSKLV